ncbi:MAG: ROK family protein, partial [Silvibacterium sp.]
SETLSRADLVRATGLSAPTVTNVVYDLISSGLVEPLGGGESSGGRPPDMIRFRTEHGCILAVDITATGVSLLLTDLNGSKPETLRFLFGNRKTTPGAVCRYIAESLRTLLQKQKKTKEQLKAVVVGVPAITNVADGVVLSISTLSEWRSVPLRRMFNEFVDCLVIIENDTNLAALGEQHRGVAQSERDFVYISLDANIGAGIILDGKIHHGSQWSAGEIAYLRLPSLSRKHPTLHEFGEMETILTSSGILRSWQEMSKKTRNGAKGAAEEIDVAQILNLAQAGDPCAEEIVLQRASMVSDIVVNLSLILNPSLVVLGGRVGSHPILIHSIRKQLQENEFAVPQIIAGALGQNAVLWGGISLALEAIPSVLLPLPAI